MANFLDIKHTPAGRFSGLCGGDFLVMLAPLCGGFTVLFREELIEARIVGKAAQDSYAFGGVGGGF